MYLKYTMSHQISKAQVNTEILLLVVRVKFNRFTIYCFGQSKQPEKLRNVHD